jgi:hypothetical protein
MVDYNLTIQQPFIEQQLGSEGSHVLREILADEGGMGKWEEERRVLRNEIKNSSHGLYETSGTGEMEVR